MRSIRGRITVATSVNSFFEKVAKISVRMSCIGKYEVKRKNVQNGFSLIKLAIFKDIGELLR